MQQGHSSLFTSEDRQEAFHPPAQVQKARSDTHTAVEQTDYGSTCDLSLHLLPSRADSGSPSTPEDDFCISPLPVNLSSPIMFPIPVFHELRGLELEGDIPGVEPKRHPRQKEDTKRRCQNREAQRRFRERREKERAELLDRLEVLRAENERKGDFLEQIRQVNVLLEGRNKRLETELEMLRKWRQKVTCVLSELIQEDDPIEDDLLVTMGASCSSSCWRRRIQYSRTSITMRTLVSLSEESPV